MSTIPTKEILTDLLGNEGEEVYTILKRRMGPWIRKYEGDAYPLRVADPMRRLTACVAALFATTIEAVPYDSPQHPAGTLRYCDRGEPSRNTLFYDSKADVFFASSLYYVKRQIRQEVSVERSIGDGTLADVRVEAIRMLDDYFEPEVVTAWKYMLEEVPGTLPECDVRTLHSWLLYLPWLTPAAVLTLENVWRRVRAQYTPSETKTLLDDAFRTHEK